MQIGIVVRDLDATIGRYEDDFGIGPWETHEINSADVKDLREYGRRTVDHAWRVAVTTIGSVMWELIQPLDQAGIYAPFLAEKGEGVHHIALATPKFDELVARQIEEGRELVGSGARSMRTESVTAQVRTCALSFPFSDDGSSSVNRG
jgi:hypothetical protein